MGKIKPGLDPVLGFLASCQPRRVTSEQTNTVLNHTFKNILYQGEKKREHNYQRHACQSQHLQTQCLRLNITLSWSVNFVTMATMLCWPNDLSPFNSTEIFGL